jgi:hypothetical protein
MRHAARLARASALGLGLGLAALASPIPAHAADAERTGPLQTRNLGGISIVGNEEAPRSLYIVPWKTALPGRVEPAPFRRMATDALAPVDPDVFERELEVQAAVRERLQSE